MDVDKMRFSVLAGVRKGILASLTNTPQDPQGSWMFQVHLENGR